jgi:lipopolysaccharide transport system permease protein
MNPSTHHFLELLWGMTEKELRARYKNTVFGFLWLVINPLLQMLIIGFIFTFLQKEPVEHYYYHLFIGLIIWNFFSTSLAKTTSSIVNERSLIKKAAFPRAVIPLSIILSNLINIIVALILFTIPVIFLGTMSIQSLPAFLLASCMLLIFTFGFSLLTAALDVRFRDINFFVQALLILWFYVTPIIYSLGQIPRNLLWLWRFNPLTSILQLMQFAFLGAAMPGPAMLASNISVTIIITIIGVLVFRHESKNFDDWL